MGLQEVEDVVQVPHGRTPEFSVAGGTELTGRPLHLGELGVLAGGTWGGKHTQAACDTLATRKPRPHSSIQNASSLICKKGGTAALGKDGHERGQMKDLAQGLAHRRAQHWCLAGRGRSHPPPPPELHSCPSSHFPVLTHRLSLSTSLLVCTPGPDMRKGKKTQKDLSCRLWLVH